MCFREGDSMWLGNDFSLSLTMYHLGDITKILLLDKLMRLATTLFRHTFTRVVDSSSSSSSFSMHVWCSHRSRASLSLSVLYIGPPFSLSPLYKVRFFLSTLPP